MERCIFQGIEIGTDDTTTMAAVSTDDWKASVWSYINMIVRVPRALIMIRVFRYSFRFQFESGRLAIIVV